MQDEVITCKDCGLDFTYAVEEQRFFEEKGFQPPKRCPDCRRKKRAQKGRRPSKG